MVTTPRRLTTLDQGVARLNQADRGLFRLYDSILTAHGFQPHTDYLSRDAFTVLYRAENSDPQNFDLSYMLTILPDVHAARPVFAKKGHVIEMLDLPSYGPYALRRSLEEARIDTSTFSALVSVTDPVVCSKVLGRLAYAAFGLSLAHYDAFLDCRREAALKMTHNEKTAFNRAANCILAAYAEPEDADLDDPTSLLETNSYQFLLPNALTVFDWCYDAICATVKKPSTVYARRIHPHIAKSVTQKGLEICFA
ncbi:hypothetical protein [Microcystis phage Mvi-JY20]|uniref:Uncharacterized protein n=1 Tax=Microcystis phage Mvi-JY20 TaxID=3128146 RepID=A0AAX4QHU1_9CAUD